MKVQYYVDDIEKPVLFIFVKSNVPIGFRKTKSCEATICLLPVSYFDICGIFI